MENYTDTVKESLGKMFSPSSTVNTSSKLETKRVHKEEENTHEAVTAWQPLSKAMLLSTTYGLNASNSKTVTVGLELVNGNTFEVAIKFSGRGSPGVSLNTAEWAQLYERMTFITPWFRAAKGPTEKQASLMQPLGRQNISLTTAYNEKAILLDVKRPATESIDEEKQQQQSKRPKNMYPAGILFQKPTYDGLVMLSKCIFHRIRLLEDELDLVKKTRDIIVEKISNVGAVEDWHNVTREKVSSFALEYIVDGRTPLTHKDARTIPREDEETCDKRRLIAKELICIHHEYIFRAVVARMRDLP